MCLCMWEYIYIYIYIIFVQLETVPTCETTGFACFCYFQVRKNWKTQTLKTGCVISRSRLYLYRKTYCLLSFMKRMFYFGAPLSMIWHPILKLSPRAWLNMSHVTSLSCNKLWILFIRTSFSRNLFRKLSQLIDCTSSFKYIDKNDYFLFKKHLLEKLNKAIILSRR